MSIKTLVSQVFLIMMPMLTFSIGYKSGYIVTLENDTLNGYIYQYGDRSLSFEVEFKNNLDNEEIKTYKPDQIKSFCFAENNKVYSSVKYTYRKDSIKIDYQRFAALIYSGGIKLYKLELPDNEIHYTYKEMKSYSYIIQKDSSQYTLSQYEEVRKIEDSKYSNYKDVEFRAIRTFPILHKYYIGVLNYLFYDCKGLAPLIKDLDFNDKEIINIIKKYEKCQR